MFSSTGGLLTDAKKSMGMLSVSHRLRDCGVMNCTPKVLMIILNKPHLIIKGLLLRNI